MPSSSMPPEVAAFITAISNPTRTELLRLLAAGEYTAPELADATGIDVTTAKRHLVILEDASLVSADRPRHERKAGRGNAVRWRARPSESAVLTAAWLTYVTKS